MHLILDILQIVAIIALVRAGIRAIDHFASVPTGLRRIRGVEGYGVWVTNNPGNWEIYAVELDDDAPEPTTRLIGEFDGFRFGTHLVGTEEDARDALRMIKRVLIAKYKFEQEQAQPEQTAATP